MERRKMLLGLAALSGIAAAGGGVTLDRAAALPGQNVLDHKLGRCDVAVPEPGAAAGPLVTGVLNSRHLRRRTDFTVAYPPGHSPGAPLPVCLLLHGAGWQHRGWFDAMHFHRHLADAVRGGVPPFALAACDGDRLYWQRQPDGRDPQAMLVEEFLPLLAERGLAVPAAGRRMAVLGCSMGGYGALLLGVMRPDLCAAVVASSPALRSSRDASGPYDVVGRADRLRSVRVRVDCGRRDPVRPAVDELAGRLPEGSVRVVPRGCHDPAFWEAQAPAQLAFIGQALADQRA